MMATASTSACIDGLTTAATWSDCLWNWSEVITTRYESVPDHLGANVPRPKAVVRRIPLRGSDCRKRSEFS
jgi:hypothetical protein